MIGLVASRLTKRDRPRVHLATLTQQPGDFKFEGTLLATADFFIVCAEPFSIRRLDQVVHVSSDYGIGAVSTDDRQTSCIHVKQSAVGPDEHHAFGRCLDDVAKTFLALAQIIFGVAALESEGQLAGEGEA